MRPSQTEALCVPNDFDIWDAVSAISVHAPVVAAVPPGGEPAGRRNVSINVNFITKKVLMFKSSSNFQLAVSEVEFITCSNGEFNQGTITSYSSNHR